MILEVLLFLGILLAVSLNWYVEHQGRKAAEKREERLRQLVDDATATIRQQSSIIEQFCELTGRLKK